MSITESASGFDNLESMPVGELLKNINDNDKAVPYAVEGALSQIENLVTAIAARMKRGGRLFYIGAGTSGRLGIVYASECPPTFGVSPDLIVGIIAGGDGAIRKAVEFAEDDKEQAWRDLEAHHIGSEDSVIGIAASGRTPYVIGGLETCRQQHILTGCITCNPGTVLAKVSMYPIEVIVGPEFVTGSTRMKAGTAQKLVLNMISTSLMILLGRIKGNKMVDMQLSNYKLIERGTNMIAEELKLSKEEAKNLLIQYGSVRNAIKNYKK